MFETGPAGGLLEQKQLHSRRAPGNTCISSLSKLNALNAVADNDSAGCGTVMRVAPIGLFAAAVGIQNNDFGGWVFRLGVEDARITHGHPSAQLPAGFLALVITRLALGASLDSAVDEALRVLILFPGHEPTYALLQDSIRRARTKPGDAAELSALGQGWTAHEALAIALYCALGAKDFRSAVRLAVSHSGDSDSTGAIAGNLLGAACGVQTIPGSWIGQLELRDVIEHMAACIHGLRSC